jgi:endonuclease/exonuclease/phosphatase family metal-dependent hydrolase
MAEVTFLQWNVLYGEDIHNIAAFLKAEQPDIACLQELTIGYPKQTEADTPHYLAETLGYHYYHKDQAIDGTDGDHLTFVIGIFSRFPMTSKRFVWLNQPEWGGEFRAYIEVDLEVDGRTLTVGTTHLTYTDRFIPTTSKEQEFARLLATVQGREQRFILSGDLNVVPDFHGIAELRQRFQPADPPYGQKTWTTKPFDYLGFKTNELDWRLDYVFASRDIKVLDTVILPTDYSDHLPVKTVFELP